MELFLVQHGRAMAKADDLARPLTPEGAETVEKMSAWVRDTALCIQQIRHSGKLRAEQTAQILAKVLKPTGGVVPVSGLDPNDDVRPVGLIAGTELANTMLVGHLPFLSRLAGYLITGNPEIQVVRFQNAGIVSLVEGNGGWSINWMMIPELLVL